MPRIPSRQLAGAFWSSRRCLSRARRHLAGEALSWRFQPLRLLLAPACSYTPDFKVILPDGRLDLAEVKGFWRDGARVKTKLAAAAFSELGFVAVQRKKVAWGEEHF